MIRSNNNDNKRQPAAAYTKIKISNKYHHTLFVLLHSMDGTGRCGIARRTTDHCLLLFKWKRHAGTLLHRIS